MTPLGAIGAGLIALCAALAALSHYGFEAPLWGLDPVLWLVGLMMTAGALWLALPPALRQAGATASTPFALITILAIGLAMRLVFFASEPLLEIDYHRYLWDGAAIGAGLNPYAASPDEARFGPAPEAWRALAAAHPEEAAAVSYPHLRTIYPPVAQAAFALAHALDPFSLTALRIVLLAAELAALALLAILLREAGRPASWLALYWWNPLVAKELINSAHMEAVLLPLLLAALLLAARRRFLWAAGALALAAGAKLWPLLWGAVTLRGAGWTRCLLASALIGALLALMAAPVVLARLDDGSGFVAYAGGWERNAALFPLIADGIGTILDALGLHRIDSGAAARLLVALAVASLAALIALRPIDGARDLARRALIVTAAFFLLSPTGYPWYFIWFAPLLAIHPWLGLRWLTLLLPLYALRYLLEEQGRVGLFDDVLVWVEFGPALAMLAWEAARRRRRETPLGQAA